MTFDNQPIYLSQDALDKISSFGALCIGGGVIFFALFFPVVLIIDGWLDVGGKIFSVLCLALTIFYIFYAKIVAKGIYERRRPAALFAIGNLFNYRFYLLSSMMWMGLGSVHPIGLVLIALFWSLLEILRIRDRISISDEMLEKIFGKEYKISADGSVEYTPSDAINDKRLSSVGSGLSKLVERVAFWALGIAVIFGPFIFIRSQLYRDNFEPRFIIIGTLAFVLGMSVFGIYSRIEHAKRALHLRGNTLNS